MDFTLQNWLLLISMTITSFPNSPVQSTDAASLKAPCQHSDVNWVACKLELSFEEFCNSPGDLGRSTHPTTIHYKINSPNPQT
eukprot:4842104-Amphidinium_carterae.1